MHVLRVKCQLCFSLHCNQNLSGSTIPHGNSQKIKKIFQGLSGFYMRTDGRKDRF